MHKFLPLWLFPQVKKCRDAMHNITKLRALEYLRGFRNIWCFVSYWEKDRENASGHWHSELGCLTPSQWKCQQPTTMHAYTSRRQPQPGISLALHCTAQSIHCFAVVLQHLFRLSCLFKNAEGKLLTAILNPIATYGGLLGALGSFFFLPPLAGP